MNLKIRVRTVRSGDDKRILEIRNTDGVRRNFCNTEKVSPVEHDQWFAKQLKPENRKRFLVATREGKIVGYIRYDLRNNDYTVSIATEQKFQRLGIGSILLTSSLPKMLRDGRLIRAEVKKDNLPSQMFFEKHGFNYLDEDDGYKYFIWSPINGPIVIATSHVWDQNALSKFTKRIDRDVVIFREREQFEKKRLKRLNPAYIFFPHWSWIIPEDIWGSYRCIVFHMTNLPFGRGGSPLQNLIIRGYLKTKISAVSVNNIVDGGPIYLKHRLSLTGNAQQIYRRSFRTILYMIEKIVNKNPTPKKQVGEAVVFNRRTPGQSGLPAIGSLRKLYDFIRMLDAETYPRAFLDHGDFLLSFSKAKIHANSISAYVTIQKKIHEKK